MCPWRWYTYAETCRTYILIFTYIWYRAYGWCNKFSVLMTVFIRTLAGRIRVFAEELSKRHKAICGVPAQPAGSCDWNQIHLISLDFVQSLLYLKGKPETRQQLITGGALGIWNTMEHISYQHSMERQEKYYSWRGYPFRKYGLIVMVKLT
jgi:hypothetical protein